VPSSRRRTRDDPATRREQIIDEAIRIVGQRGYRGFGIQELGQRCGVSKAGVLYHFESKDQLFLAVLKELERRERQIVGPLAYDPKAKPSAAAIIERLRTLVALAVTQPELGRFHTIMVSESLDPDHPAHASFCARQARALDGFAKALAPYVANPRATARQLLALLQGLTLQWYREKQSFDLVAQWVRAVQTLVPALVPPGRPPQIRQQPTRSARDRQRAPMPKRRK